MWVLDGVFQDSDVNINKIIIDILHNLSREKTWYTIKYITNIYGNEIANGVKNINEKKLNYFDNVHK